MQATQMDVQFPLANLFLTLVWFVLLCIWVITVFAVLTDVFRSRDLSGGRKAAWTVFVLVLPLLGAVVYLSARGGSLHQRAEDRVGQSEGRLDRYVQRAVGTPPPVAGTGTATDAADQRSALQQLHERGILSDRELADALARLGA